MMLWLQRTKACSMVCSISRTLPGQGYLRKACKTSVPVTALFIEAGDGIEDQVQTIVKESMEEAFKKIIPEVPFVAEIRVADSWTESNLIF